MPIARSEPGPSTFNDNTSVTLTGPGVSTNFTLATEMADKFAGQMLLHFGTFKNRVINNSAAVIFSRIQVNGGFGAFDETFPGPGLNPDPQNPLWRLAADATGITWIPQGTAYWLTWTLPDTGFTVQSSSSLTGQWSSPALNYVIEGSTSKSAAVPTSLLPSPGAGFFRLMKSGQSPLKTTIRFKGRRFPAPLLTMDPATGAACLIFRGFCFSDSGLSLHHGCGSQSSRAFSIMDLLAPTAYDRHSSDYGNSPLFSPGPNTGTSQVRTGNTDIGYLRPCVGSRGG